MKQQDPLALAFFGAALALLAGLLLYVIFFKKPEQVPPERASLSLDKLTKRAEEALARLRTSEPTAKPAPAPAPGKAAQARPPVAAGKTFVYAVTVEPPVWRDITLAYRTEARGSSVGVQTDFKHAGGQMKFYLGSLVPGDPSHANTRFPGFFLYPSYFRLPLEPGQKFDWNWGWQPEREGRRKAWYAQVVRKERVTVPAGTFDAVVMQLNLAYMEGSEVRARGLEYIWYAPEVSQIVRITREGRTPDESSQRIVAELAELR